MLKQVCKSVASYPEKFRILVGVLNEIFHKSMTRHQTKLFLFTVAVVFLSFFVSCVKAVTEIPVSAIAIAQDTAEMTEGETLQLAATITPSDATNKNITWTSSNVAVASVSKDGIVTALKEGTSTIYAMAETKKAQCTVTVKPLFIPVTSVTLDRTRMDLPIGSTETLTSTVKPDNATDRSVTWSSSDETVATVSDGKVTAVKLGTATITAKSGDITAKCTVTVNPIAVTSITLDVTELLLKIGESYTLKATVKPDDATIKTVNWSSSDDAVVVVSEGKVTAKGAGTAVISAKSGSVSAECTVTIKPIEVTSVTLDKEKIVLDIGTSETLTATVKPDDATDKTVYWSSSDESVAVVSEGKVTAKGVGTAYITARAGNKTAVCAVTVNPIHVKSVSLNYSSIDMVVGDEKVLAATVLPENATDKSVSWNSDNSSVAEVSEGRVSARGNGTATITVETTDGKLQAKCQVKVKANVQELSLSLNSFMGGTGKTYSIWAITKPEDAACDISWSSSNSSIASVSGSGKKATISVASGYYTYYTTITAKDRITGKSASIKVANTVSDFEWKENTGKTYSGYPLVTIAIGEKHQLNYSCSPYPLDNIFEDFSNFVFYEPTYVVDNPTNISIDANGVVTGLKTGTTGIKATGAVMKRSGGVDRVYIKVVDGYEESEPNNDFPYATTIKTGFPMKFYISTTTDVDVFKFTNPVSGSEQFNISISYDGDYSSVDKKLKWELYNGECSLMGAGTLTFSPSGGTTEFKKWLNTGTGYLKFYFPTNYYSYPETLPTGTLSVKIN